MRLLEIVLILGVVGSLSLTLLYFWLSNENNQLEKRKRQSQNNLRENVIRRRIEEFSEKRIKYSKRYAIETLCLQAGLKISYAEYLMISIGTGILFGVLSLFAMKSFIFVPFSLIVGFILPKQIISFLKNRRVSLIDKQVGSFMLMVIKRYENTKDFKKALELTTYDFRGEEPLYSELKETVMEVNLGKPLDKALKELGRRTGNKYMMRFADYYEIASAIGTDDTRHKLLNQAFMQYEENRKAKSIMKRELSNVKNQAYVMLGAIPAFALFQINTNDDYIRFMTQDPVGQAGSLIVIGIIVGGLWFINNKISAPLD